MIELRELEFAYDKGEFVLRISQLTIARGETVAIVGPSGSGKTTLLNLLAGILRPDRGRVGIQDVDLAAVDNRTARDFRAAHIGLIFQEFELLEYLCVRDNILLPFRINRKLHLSAAVYSRANELAARVGIIDKLDRFPGQLSQGEKQRVAVCRALITGPALILADEPTGNLDQHNKIKVLDILLDCVREKDTTLVTVTHDLDLVSRFDTVVDFSSLTDAAGHHTS